MTRRSLKTAAQARPRVCVCVGVGNSLTLDYFSSLGPLLSATQQSHPRQVWTVYNKAVGSTQTPTFTSTFATAVQPLFKNTQLCLLHFCEVSNHIAAGASFVTARDAAIAYCVQARTAGWKLAFHIPTPRVEVTDPGYEGSVSAWSPGEKAIYEETCAYFRTHAEHYDFLVDLPTVPQLAAPQDTTYYQSDGVHCTAAGITAKAAAVAAATVSWGF